MVDWTRYYRLGSHTRQLRFDNLDRFFRGQPPRLLTRSLPMFAVLPLLSEAPSHLQTGLALLSRLEPQAKRLAAS